MTVTIEIGGRSYPVPPFMLAEMELAAPHIDRMNELFPEFQEAIKEKRVLAMAKQLQLLRAMVEILAVGIANVDPEVTAESIFKSVNFSFAQSLGTAVRELLKSSGLSPEGEATAPSPRRGKGAKASRSR